MVNWKADKQPSCNGGLGSKSLLLFNEALISKWLWWFTVDNEHLGSRRVVVAMASVLSKKKGTLEALGPKNVSGKGKEHKLSRDARERDVHMHMRAHKKSGS